MHVTDEELESFREQSEATGFHCPNCNASAGFISRWAIRKHLIVRQDNRATLWHWNVSSATTRRWPLAWANPKVRQIN